jgi:elongation factor 1-beta
MGEVAIGFEIMPDGIEVDLVQLKTQVEGAINDICSIQSTEERPVAFGLKALHMTVVVEDKEGIMDQLEETIGRIDGVQNAKVVSLTKL